jgi:hypothetical protein
MDISTPKQVTKAPALTAAGLKLMAIRDAMSEGASLRKAGMAQGLQYYTVSRWVHWEAAPDHVELLSQIRELHASRASRKVWLEQRETEKKAERRHEVQATQAARVAEMNQGAEIPPDALTYREAALRVDRHWSTIQGWVSAKKLRNFYRLNDQSGIESLVSLASVERVANDPAGSRAIRRDRAIRCHELKIPMLVDLLMSGVPKNRACAELGVTVSTLNAWIQDPSGLGPAASALLVDLNGSALNEKRRLLASRMERVLDAVRAGATLRQAAAQIGESRYSAGAWLHGVSDCEDLCARFRDEYAAAKKQGRDVRAKEKEGQAQVTAKPRSKASWVYFIQDVDRRGNIKIGFTARTVEKRIAELGTGSPVLLVVLRKVRASRSFEAWLHERFAEERQYGEWFRPSLRVLAFIDQVKDHPEMTA